MQVSRRNLLALASTTAIGGLVAACTTNPTTGQVELDPTVIDAIQSGVAKAASYIPAVESIAATAASLFGPGYSAIVQIGSTALNTLIQALASVVGNLSPAQSANLAARLRTSSPSNPVVVGTTAGGIVVTGFHI